MRLAITPSATLTITEKVMYQGINHPINDPSLVSYHRPELVKILPQLEQAYDCWTLLNADGLGAARASTCQRNLQSPIPPIRPALVDRPTLPSTVTASAPTLAC